MLFLRTLGGLSLDNGGRPITGAAGQRGRLAILAVLAVARDRGLSRDRLLAYFWPESDTEHARGALKQAVFQLRRDAGERELLLGTTELRLNPVVIQSDIGDFDRAFEAGDLECAVELYAGPFLDGIHLNDVPEFDQWVERQRDRIAERYHTVLEQLAKTAAASGDSRAAVEWWRKLVGADPLSAAIAASLMKALVAAGDSPAALRHARVYGALVRKELGTDPDPAILELAERIREALNAAEAAQSASSAGALAAPKPRIDATVTGPAEPAAMPAQSRSRPRSVLIGAAALVALGGGVVAALRATHRPLDPRRVVVVALGSSGLPRLVAEGIARKLTSAAITTPQVLLSGTAPDPRQAASRAGAGLVLSVSATSTSQLTVETVLTNAVTGDRLWSSPPMVAPPAGTAGALDSLAERSATAVAVRLDPKLANWIAQSSQPSSLESYREFRRGLDFYTELDSKAAIPHFLTAATQDTAFTMALILAAMTLNGEPVGSDSIARLLQPRRLPPLDRALVDYQLALFAGDLGAKFTAAGAVAQAAPRSEWLMLLARSQVGRPREAIRVLEQIGPELGWLRDYWWYWNELGLALHFAGEHERELAVMEEAHRRYPTNRIIAQGVVKALAALGRVAEVEAEVDRALTLRQKSIWLDNQPMGQAVSELRAHGYPDAARRLAERTIAWIGRLPPDERTTLQEWLPDFLVEAGHLTEARIIRAQNLARDPNDLDALTDMATLCAEQGDRATARRLDARLARKEMSNSPFRGQVLWRRAMIAASLGEREAAVDLLRDAFRAGWGARSILHWQREFASLKGYPPFETLARPVD